MKFLWRISILMMLAITLSPAANAAPGDVKWTYEPDNYLYTVDCSIAPDGTVYLGQAYFEWYMVSPSPGRTVFVYSLTNRMIALNPAGHAKWTYEGAGLNSTVRKDGRILAYGIVPQYSQTGTLTNIARCMQGINPDGTPWLAYTNGLYWALTTNDVAIVSFDTVADDSPISSDLPANYGLAKTDLSTPSQVWTNQTLHLLGAPAVSPDGGVYISRPEVFGAHSYTSTGTVFHAFAGYLYAFDRQGGLRWQLIQSNISFNISAIGADGSVCLGTSTFQENQNLTSFQFRVVSPDGQTKWTAAGPGRFSPAVVDAQNNIYVGSGNKLICFNSDGGIRWQTNYSIYYSPALAADGTLYVTSGTVLYAINSANGNHLWSREIGRSLTSPLKIGDDGTLYQLAENRYLLAIHGTSPPANSPWPQDRHDAQRTGRARQLGPVNIGQKVDGKFSLTLLLEPGKTYKVDVSDDLETWTEIGSFNGSSAAQTFLDESSADKPKRFYRLVVP